MKRWLLSFGIFALLFLSCRKKKETGYDPGLHTRTIVFDGMSRRYAVYIPEGIENRSVPLIFELHGGGVYIEDLTGESGHKTPYKLWMPMADTAKFIVVYPEGLNGAYGKPTWNDCRANCSVNSHADDVGFISALIDTLSSRYRIDMHRIYVSGMSNGGLMALRLAFELTDCIAAVSTVGASLPDSSLCSLPQMPVSVSFMNGTDDWFLPYEGGTLSHPPKPSHGTVYPVEYSVKWWVRFNQTDTIPQVFTFPDLDPGDGGNVELFRYKNGLDHTEVLLYKIHGGGHSAPSIRERYSALFEQYFGKQNHDIEMTFEAWKFFRDKRR